MRLKQFSTYYIANLSKSMIFEKCWVNLKKPFLSDYIWVLKGVGCLHSWWSSVLSRQKECPCLLSIGWKTYIIWPWLRSSEKECKGSECFEKSSGALVASNCVKCYVHKSECAQIYFANTRKEVRDYMKRATWCSVQ